MFNPVAGAVAVLGGVAMGAFAGQATESGQQSIRYPELISIPMNCAPLTAVAPVGGGTFGLAIRGLAPELARAAGLGAHGAVLVTSVAAGGRAEAAGLRSGDIILAAGGRALGDAADLQEWLLAMVSDAPLALRVWRDGQVLELALSRAAAAQ
jgi:S1-C subfamily serine protease